MDETQRFNLLFGSLLNKVQPACPHVIPVSFPSPRESAALGGGDLRWRRGPTAGPKYPDDTGVGSNETPDRCLHKAAAISVEHGRLHSERWGWLWAVMCVPPSAWESGSHSGLSSEHRQGGKWVRTPGCLRSSQGRDWLRSRRGEGERRWETLFSARPCRLSADLAVTLLLPLPYLLLPLLWLHFWLGAGGASEVQYGSPDGCLNQVISFGSCLSLQSFNSHFIC